MEKKIVIVWGYYGKLLVDMQRAVVSSYKNNRPLDKAFSDLITYEVYETETEVRLIIKFI